MTAIPITADRPHILLGHTTLLPITPARRLPFGCVTGHAKAVEVSLAKAAISGRARQLLQLVHVRSFGDAGYHQSEPGLWCEFSLADWARELGMQRQNLWRLREQLVEQRVISYQPSAADPARGIIRWNLNFSEWRVLDEEYRRSRYTRRNAGKESTALPVAANGVRLVPATDPHEGESNRLRLTGPRASNRLQNTPSAPIKVMTPACSETAATQGAADLLRKVTKKGRKKDADASRTTRARGRSTTPDHNGETTGAYWTRRIVEAGDDVGQQRTMVYEALRELLHMTLVEQAEFAKISIVFQHAGRSWPTVLSWILRASIVPHGQKNPIAYLLGTRLARRPSSSDRRRPLVLPVTPASAPTTSEELATDDALPFQPRERTLVEEIRWAFMRRGEQVMWDRCSGIAEINALASLAPRFVETGVSVQDGAALVYRACSELHRYASPALWTKQQMWASIIERIENTLVTCSTSEAHS